MAVPEKALVGKLIKFPVGIRRIFALSTNSSTADGDCMLFLPYKDQQNEPKSEQDTKSGLSQTYPQWKVMLDFQKLHSLQKRRQFKKRKIYILPMGPLDQKTAVNILEQNGLSLPHSSFFDKVVEFASLFFSGMDVELLEFLNTNLLNFNTRIHSSTKKRQVLVKDILDYLKKIKPKDCFCMVGWSWLDLYPSPELNFVLGEACFQSGCAVISFGHYSSVKTKEIFAVDNIHLENKRLCASGDPVSGHCSSFGNPSTKSSMLSTNMSKRSSVGQPPSSNLHAERLDFHTVLFDDAVVWRVFKVLTHEVCHTLGMHHCTLFACLMNESSNVYQAQDQPLFLCPVCLRKLQKFLRFSVLTRYKAMKNYMEQYCQIIRTSHEATRLYPSRNPSAELTSESGVVENCLPNSRSINRGLDSSPDTMNLQFPVERSTNIRTLDKFEHCVTWLRNALIYIDSEVER